MPTVRGKAGVQAYMAALPEKLKRVMRGAARAGGKVFEDYVSENTPSDAVRAALRTRTSVEGDKITVKTDLKPGWGRSVGNWLEYGTKGHFISVDDSQRGGKSIGRINKQVREADGDHSLVISGQFVGSTVWHPGANPHPVFRPAGDLKEGEALAAAQAYINTHVTRAGIIGAEEGDE